MVVNKSCVAACLESVRMAVESVSGCSWNECPDQRGITVRMCVEWVSESAWNPHVTLRGGVNQFMEPQFELDDAHASYAAGLQSGMRISLICTGRGDVSKTPMSKDCAPAN